MSDLTPKGFSNGQYVDRFRLLDKLYQEDAITMRGVAIMNNFPAADVRPVVTCGECRKCATDECHFFTHGEWGMSGPDYWFYCADGKRRTE